MVKNDMNPNNVNLQGTDFESLQQQPMIRMGLKKLRWKEANGKQELAQILAQGKHSVAISSTTANKVKNTRKNVIIQIKNFKTYN